MRQFLLSTLALLVTCAGLFAKDHNILDFGAKPGGAILCTSSIQAAIDQAHAEGGGRVVVPAGTFLTGGVVLKSGVELHLQKKAVLLGSTNPDDYTPIHTDTCVGVKGLVMARGARRIAVTGQGTLDSQGAVISLKLDSLYHIGKLGDYNYRMPERRPKWYTRPQMIHFMDCHDIRITGITLKNGACWVQTYTLCTKLLIDGIRVESDTYWNNDGIDIADCRNVIITNCDINSSDDGICLKSYVNSYCYKSPDIVACDSIYIANCRVRSSASAVKLGSAGYGGFRNVTIRDIKVYDTFRSAIALEMVSGGTLENVLVEGIRATNTGNAIFIRLGAQHRDTPGVLRNVVIRDLRCAVPFAWIDQDYEIRGPELPFFHNVFPASITGLPGHPVQDIRLEDIRITYPGRGNPAFANMPTWRLWSVPEQAKLYPEFSMFGELPAWGLYVRHAEGITLKDVEVRIKRPDYRPAFVFDDVKGLKTEGIVVEGDEKPGNGMFMQDVVPAKGDE